MTRSRIWSVNLYFMKQGIIPSATINWTHFRVIIHNLLSPSLSLSPSLYISLSSLSFSLSLSLSLYLSFHSYLVLFTYLYISLSYSPLSSLSLSFSLLFPIPLHFLALFPSLIHFFPRTSPWFSSHYSFNHMYTAAGW